VNSHTRATTWLSTSEGGIPLYSSRTCRAAVWRLRVLEYQGLDLSLDPKSYIVVPRRFLAEMVHGHGHGEITVNANAENGTKVRIRVCIKLSEDI